MKSMYIFKAIKEEYVVFNMFVLPVSRKEIMGTITTHQFGIKTILFETRDLITATYSIFLCNRAL